MWAFSLSADRKPFRYLSRFEGSAALSPNGRWLAFVEKQAATRQVVVQSFPDSFKGRHQISSKGGEYPRWRRDGRELFFVDTDRNFVSVPVSADGKFAIEQATVLFSVPRSLVDVRIPPDSDLNHPYDVAPDGKRFLFTQRSLPGAASPIRVVLNWTAGLEN